MIHIPDSVFPKDLDGNALCPRCRKVLKDCDCPAYEPQQPAKPLLRPVIRLDKSGRKGKIVTMVSALPCDETLLKELSKTLKVKTGSGGTFFIAEGSGIIEVQGDHKKTIEKFFAS